MIAIVLVVISYVMNSSLYLTYELSSSPSIPPFRSDKYIKLYNSLNMINGKNNIYVVCLFSWIALDDDKMILMIWLVYQE